jgi:hypothetical protein
MRAVGTERGEGRLGTIVGLVLFLAVVLAIWNLAPVFWADYNFSDKLNEIARIGRHKSDDELMRMIMREVSENKLENYIKTATCKITTMDTRRTIRCEYHRTVQILPGFNHTFHFKDEADQPVL